MAEMTLTENELDEQKEEKDRPPVEKQNRKLKVYMITIIAFVLFMFSSKYVLSGKKADPELGPVVSGRAEYSVTSWLYDKETNVIEVVIGIEGLYKEADDMATKCEYSQSNGKEVKTGYVIYNTMDCIVVRYQAGTRFNRMRIAIYIPDDTIYFENNKDNMTAFSYNEQKELKDYRIESKEQLKVSYEQKIADNTASISDKEQRQEEIKAEILSIRDRETYMTTQQIRDAESQIAGLQNDITTLDREKQDLEDEIEEYKQRISNIEKAIQDIKDGNI